MHSAKKNDHPDVDLCDRFSMHIIFSIIIFPLTFFSFSFDYYFFLLLFFYFPLIIIFPFTLLSFSFDYYFFLLLFFSFSFDYYFFLLLFFSFSFDYYFLFYSSFFIFPLNIQIHQVCLVCHILEYD